MQPTFVNGFFACLKSDKFAKAFNYLEKCVDNNGMDYEEVRIAMEFWFSDHYKIWG